MGLIRAALYMLAQTCGAILGAGILWAFTTNEVQLLVTVMVIFYQFLGYGILRTFTTNEVQLFR